MWTYKAYSQSARLYAFLFRAIGCYDESPVLQQASLKLRKEQWMVEYERLENIMNGRLLLLQISILYIEWKQGPAY